MRIMDYKIITFGTWNSRPIEWIILDSNELYTLLISRKTVNMDAYYKLDLKIKEQKESAWKNSVPRIYLNGFFYLGAFTNEEKKYIVNTNTQEKGMVKTKDDIFLLSYEQSQKYLSSREILCSNCTAGWWLRSIEEHTGSAWYVSKDGDYKHDCIPWGGTKGIRPAVHILNSYSKL